MKEIAKRLTIVIITAILVYSITFFKIIDFNDYRLISFSLILLPLMTIFFFLSLKGKKYIVLKVIYYFLTILINMLFSIFLYEQIRNGQSFVLHLIGFFLNNVFLFIFVKKEKGKNGILCE